MIKTVKAIYKTVKAIYKTVNAIHKTVKAIYKTVMPISPRGLARDISSSAPLGLTDFFFFFIALKPRVG